MNNIVLIVLSDSKIVTEELVEVMPLELRVSEQWVSITVTALIHSSVFIPASHQPCGEGLLP